MWTQFSHQNFWRDVVNTKSSSARLHRSCAHFVIAFLAVTFILAFTSSAISYSAIRVKGGKRSYPSQSPKDEELSFKLVIEGRGLKKGATSVSFGRFESPDGMTVERRIERYSSASRAHKEMQRMIAKSEKVIERGPNQHQQKRQAGERVVLVQRGSLARLGQTLVVWNDGPDIYVLQSSSMRHALSFERQVYK